MHLKEQLIKKRASQMFFETKSKIRASQVTIHQKRASQIFLDPIQKRALSRFVQLEAVYLEALLYWICFHKIWHKLYLEIQEALFLRSNLNFELYFATFSTLFTDLTRLSLILSVNHF